MQITKQYDNSTLTILFEGQLDTYTSPIAEKEIGNIDDVTELILDFQKLKYISSAGIRFISHLQIIMNEQGSMVIRHVNAEVMEIFDITGLTNIFTIE